jgi:hypothetical protein
MQNLDNVWGSPFAMSRTDAQNGVNIIFNAIWKTHSRACFIQIAFETNLMYTYMISFEYERKLSVTEIEYIYPLSVQL